VENAPEGLEGKRSGDQTGSSSRFPQPKEKTGGSLGIPQKDEKKIIKSGERARAKERLRTQTMLKKRVPLSGRSRRAMVAGGIAGSIPSSKRGETIRGGERK